MTAGRGDVQLAVKGPGDGAGGLNADLALWLRGWARERVHTSLQHRTLAGDSMVSVVLF